MWLLPTNLSTHTGSISIYVFLTRSRMHKIHFGSSEARESIFYGARYTSKWNYWDCGLEEIFPMKKKKLTIQQTSTFSHTFLKLFIWKSSHSMNVVVVVFCFCSSEKTWRKWWWVFLRVRKKSAGLPLKMNNTVWIQNKFSYEQTLQKLMCTHVFFFSSLHSLRR